MDMDFQSGRPTTQPNPGLAPPPPPPPPPRPEAPQSAPTPAKRKGNKVLGLLLVIIVAAACAGGVYYWQHQKVTDLTAQVSSLNSQLASTNAQLKDQKAALLALPNVVEVSAGNTTDLAVFLGSVDTSCYKKPTDGKGYFKINKEVNDQFAEMQYGCVNTYKTGTPTFVLATKTSGQWKLISPTNQWLTVSGVQYPSCTMVNDNKISKQLEPKCAVQTTTNGTTQITLQDVTNP